MYQINVNSEKGNSKSRLVTKKSPPPPYPPSLTLSPFPKQVVTQSLYHNHNLNPPVTVTIRVDQRNKMLVTSRT